MVNLFVSNLYMSVEQLERDNVLSVALVGVVGVTYHMSKHYLYIFVRVLKGVQFSDEDRPVFVLLSNIVNSFFGADCLT